MNAQIPVWFILSGGALAFGAVLLFFHRHLQKKVREARAVGYREGSIAATKEVRERFARRLSRAKLRAAAETDALTEHAERISKERLNWSDVDRLLEEMNEETDFASVDLVDARADDDVGESEGDG